jgi:hypothetical protein
MGETAPDEEGSWPAAPLAPVSAVIRADTYRLTELLWLEIQTNLRTPPIRYVRVRD